MKLVYSIVAASALCLFPGFAEEELLINVKHKVKGPKGTLCFQIGEDGNPTPTGDLVVVRDFFAAPEEQGQPVTLKVTSEGKTMQLRNQESGEYDTVPIVHLVERVKAGMDPAPVAKPSVEKEITRREKFFLVDEVAAIKIPAGWGVETKGLPDPLHINAEREDRRIALTIAKEGPATVEVETIKDYTSAKITLLLANNKELEISDPKEGQVNGLPAMFVKGSGTIVSTEAEVLCMMVQGKTHFYFMLGIISKGSPASFQKDLVSIMRTFKEQSE